jgi:hypothetical protein
VYLRDLTYGYYFLWNGHPYRKDARMASTIPDQMLDVFLVYDCISQEMHLMNGANRLEKWHRASVSEG